MHLKDLLANANNPRDSAVLVLLYPADEKIYVLLMLRTTDTGVHSGQVSFPGGKYETEDGTFKNTALREAGEELGIVKEQVTIIGELSPLYIPPSNFLVHPFVGYSIEKPTILPSNAEVNKVIKMDIELLFDDNLKQRKTIDVRGYSIDTPYYNIYGNVVWGATAMILSEFEEILRRILK
jgi:8-oxo-dGTP pyrophosphatase MutT (NUDIX family)